MPPYEYNGPIDIQVNVDTSKLEGRCAIVTGGASGIGEGYVEALVAAGAFVAIGDLNSDRGASLVNKYPGNVIFCECDVRDWEDQAALFKAAVDQSPHHSVDIVIANAGITSTGTGGRDPIIAADPGDEPVKPDLKVLDVNLYGLIYTTKLAFHYFRKQAVSEERDRCLILQTSIAAYAELPGAIQYQTSKFGGRGLMRALRRPVGLEQIRVNCISPWFVRTPLLGNSSNELLKSLGSDYATIEDCNRAMLRIVCDKAINGRALAVVARTQNENGFIDVDDDDCKDGPQKEWEEVNVRLLEAATRRRTAS